MALPGRGFRTHFLHCLLGHTNETSLWAVSLPCYRYTPNRPLCYSAWGLLLGLRRAGFRIIRWRDLGFWAWYPLSVLILTSWTPMGAYDVMQATDEIESMSLLHVYARLLRNLPYPRFPSQLLNDCVLL